MTGSSLHRAQRQLVRALTTPAVFEDLDHPSLVALDDLVGPDRHRISLYGRLSHAKRMHKIRGVFCRTLHFWDQAPDETAKTFLARYPPRSAQTYANARQFFEFMVRQWRAAGTRRPYLLDLARFELALSESRSLPPSLAAADPLPPNRDERHFRLSAGVTIIRCRHDVKCLLEDDDAPPPDRRPLFLLMRYPGDDEEPRIMEIGADLAMLLARARSWRRIAEGSEAIHDLGVHGFVDIG